jgi:hypothetical protein
VAPTPCRRPEPELPTCEALGGVCSAVGSWALLRAPLGPLHVGNSGDGPPVRGPDPVSAP